MGLFRRPPDPQQRRPKVIPTAPAAGSFDFTGAWVQAPASWAASASEAFEATASLTQAAASWSATASEEFPATGSWTQAAASWSADAAQVFPSTATFVQSAATWAASAAEEFATSATFAQEPATWSATASQVFTGTGAWEQTASWAAVADTTVPRAPHGAALVTGPARPYVTRTSMAATFVQPAASWRADMDTYEPLALFLLTDEPALIGAR